MRTASATVTTGDRSIVLEPGDTITFGRAGACTITLDPADRGISRLAGSVDAVEGTWFVTNRSQTRPLAVVDPFGFRTVLAPGRRTAVDGRLSVVVEGQVRRYELAVEVASGERPEPQVPSAGPETEGELETEMGNRVVYTDDDRRALVALFAGYLQPFPRHDPRPRSYADAAATLGWPRSTLVKRIEYVRTRLVKAGVPNLYGDRAQEALAEHVIATGVIGPDDLALLDPR
jgi:hypothetical protein